MAKGRLWGLVIFLVGISLGSQLFGSARADSLGAVSPLANILGGQCYFRAGSTCSIDESYGDFIYKRQEALRWFMSCYLGAEKFFGKVGEKGELIPGFDTLWPYLKKVGEHMGEDRTYLACVGFRETRWNSDAVSHKGAMGVMQTMPRSYDHMARVWWTGLSDLQKKELEDLAQRLGTTSADPNSMGIGKMIENLAMGKSSNFRNTGIAQMYDLNALSSKAKNIGIREIMEVRWKAAQVSLNQLAQVNFESAEQFRPMHGQVLKLIEALPDEFCGDSLKQCLNPEQRTRLLKNPIFSMMMAALSAQVAQMEFDLRVDLDLVVKQDVDNPDTKIDPKTGKGKEKDTLRYYVPRAKGRVPCEGKKEELELALCRRNHVAQIKPIDMHSLKAVAYITGERRSWMHKMVYQGKNWEEWKDYMNGLVASGELHKDDRDDIVSYVEDIRACMQPRVYALPEGKEVPENVCTYNSTLAMIQAEDEALRRQPTPACF